jgi:hypothetical protein
MTIVTEQTIAETVAKREAYFAELQERSLDVDALTIETINPEDMQVGDHMLFYGFVYEITKINVRDYDCELPVYLVEGLYVSGDLNMYKYFSLDKQNGCARSHFSGQQGNARATWKRVNRTKQAQH